jgi:hypothetical protein
MSLDAVENVTVDGEVLAYVIRASSAPPATVFVTPPEIGQQVGFIVYRAGTSVAPHEHLPIERRLIGTTEVLVVRQGACTLDLYRTDRTLAASHDLRQGDVAVLVRGGHGIRFHDDTVLLEVKQGPYVGLIEKNRY